MVRWRPPGACEGATARGALEGCGAPVTMTPVLRWIRRTTAAARTSQAGVVAMIHRRLWELAQQQPDGVALFDRERAVDYRELFELAGAFAGRLHAIGVAPGDRVAVLLDKSVEAVVALYGAWTA